MILIKKGPEPPSLTQYRKTPHAYYDGYVHKGLIREALLRDQGHLCAYCMRRIENNSATMKIEHWKSQSILTSEQDKLDFSIMLGVCDGCRGTNDRYTTCDEHRHDADLYVNPMDPAMMETISYDKQGHIKSSDSRINEDLNKRLNLNCEQAPSRIVQNRKNIYEEFMLRLINLQQKGMWKKSNLKHIEDYFTKEVSGRKKEFVGVPLYLIKKYSNRP